MKETISFKNDENIFLSVETNLQSYRANDMDVWYFLVFTMRIFCTINLEVQRITLGSAIIY